jgi:hypothetical protein
MTLGDANAAMPQEHRDILNRYSCLEQRASEGISETMTVPISDVRALEYPG